MQNFLIFIFIKLDKNKEMNNLLEKALALFSSPFSKICHLYMLATLSLPFAIVQSMYILSRMDPRILLSAGEIQSKSNFEFSGPETTLYYHAQYAFKFF